MRPTEWRIPKGRTINTKWLGIQISWGTQKPHSGRDALGEKPLWSDSQGLRSDGYRRYSPGRRQNYPATHPFTQTASEARSEHGASRKYGRPGLVAQPCNQANRASAENRFRQEPSTRGRKANAPRGGRGSGRGVARQGSHGGQKQAGGRGGDDVPPPAGGRRAPENQAW